MIDQCISGRVAIVGRPNTGKSTLLNALVGIKISSVSHRVQTTRHSIMGVYQDENLRIQFLDTPGFQLTHKTLLNKFMNRVISTNLKEVDVILMLIDAGRFNASDRVILEILPEGVPVLLGVNKIDKLSKRDLLLPFIDRVKLEYNFHEIIPLSGLKKDNFPNLLKGISRFLPSFQSRDENYNITDRTESFLASEIIREKLYYKIDKEIPYNSTVVIDKFVESNGLKSIFATLIVERRSHKAIVIGKKGEQLKIIASEARRDMEKLFDSKVFLQIWVKVNPGWVNDKNALKSLGYQLN